MERFIDPRTLARIKDLPLVAKTVAEGFLHGLQTSTQRGVGIEFSQYRAYENGDELSRIDWKLFARSDRYFVREAERESEIDVWFLLDASRSMQQQSEASPNSEQDLQVHEESKNYRWNKLEYAKYLIASIGYLSQKQGDSVGFVGMSSETINFLPSGNGLRHWQKLLRSLSQVNGGLNFPLVNKIKHHLNYLQKPSLIFLISDFNQRDKEILQFVSKLNTTRCEVVAIQLACDDEIDFNYKGAIRFKDLETEEEVLVSARNIKQSYQRVYQSYQQNINRELAQHNVTHCRFNIDKPLDHALMEYLKQRNRVGC